MNISLLFASLVCPSFPDSREITVSVIPNTPSLKAQDGAGWSRQGKSQLVLCLGLLFVCITSLPEYSFLWLSTEVQQTPGARSNLE